MNDRVSMVIGGGSDGFEVKVAAEIDLGTGVTDIVPEIRARLYCDGIGAEEMLGDLILLLSPNAAISHRLEHGLMGDYNLVG